MKSLRLHPKYGLNPTVSTCIICGKEKNEVALLGANYKEEAPMHMVTSIEPCDACKKRILDSDGVLLLEAEQTIEIGKKPSYKFTGSLVVIRREAFQRMCPKMEVPTCRTVFIEPGILQKIGAI